VYPELGASRYIYLNGKVYTSFWPAPKAFQYLNAFLNYCVDAPVGREQLHNGTKWACVGCVQSVPIQKMAVLFFFLLLLPIFNLSFIQSLIHKSFPSTIFFFIRSPVELNRTQQGDQSNASNNQRFLQDGGIEMSTEHSILHIKELSSTLIRKKKKKLMNGF
jgi:hypothetical protein